MPLYRRNALSDRQLLAINEVAGVLDTAALADMRRQVAGGADPQAVAGGVVGRTPAGAVSLHGGAAVNPGLHQRDHCLGISRPMTGPNSC